MNGFQKGGTDEPTAGSRRIDSILPDPDVAKRHSIRVDAPPEATWRAIRELDFARSRGVRWLFALRGLPREGVTLDGLHRSGFEILAERPGSEIVLGLIGRFWTPRGGIRRFEPETFASFGEPGFAKAAWSFEIEPDGDGARLSTETRVRCTDATSRARFLRYWRVVGPFSGWIRKRALALAREDAERAVS